MRKWIGLIFGIHILERLMNKRSVPDFPFSSRKQNYDVTNLSVFLRNRDLCQRLFLAYARMNRLVFRYVYTKGTSEHILGERFPILIPEAELWRHKLSTFHMFEFQVFRMRRALTRHRSDMDSLYIMLGHVMLITGHQPEMTLWPWPWPWSGNCPYIGIWTWFTSEI